MINTIQQAVKPHDKYQIEIKLDYELVEAKHTHYKITTYFFVPQSLGIDKNNYSKAHFYRDVRNYIRLKTPNFILRDFSENSASPLISIEKIIAAENWAGNPESKQRLIDNFKFLSAMLKSATRDHFNLIEQRIAEAGPGSKIQVIIHNLIEAFLSESQKITTSYRAFYADFNLPNVDPQIFSAYKWTDESISMLLEEQAIEIFQIVDAHANQGDWTNFKQQLNALVEAETQHRRSHGYSSILQADSDNEAYIFRSSVLKKYAASILYLSTAVRREGIGLEHFLFAIAAGVSMIFATVIAFYFQWRYGNFTFAFFAALVVGYMFKDRIKELGRALFARYLENALYDRRIVIRTQDDQYKLGVLKEKVTFISEGDLPKRVMRVRNRDPFSQLANNGHGEEIIRYTKEVVLYTDVFKKIFAGLPQISGINDIIRYDIRAYLNKMAEPVQERFYLQDEQLQAMDCHKVYHLNVVSRYASPYPEKGKLYKRSRLVLTQEGIKRVEHLLV